MKLEKITDLSNQEIQNMILKEAREYGELNDVMSEVDFREGAAWFYSLCMPDIEYLKKEVKMWEKYRNGYRNKWKVELLKNMKLGKENIKLKNFIINEITKEGK